jgi:hypothetical protein
MIQSHLHVFTHSLEKISLSNLLVFSHFMHDGLTHLTFVSLIFIQIKNIF